MAFFNLAVVLCCLKYVRPHIGLRLVLTVVCGCTYIMIASAAYRMFLYVQQYHLTFLRLLVLWFLGLLFVLMAGVSRIVWKPDFPLFFYCVAVVSLFYIGLAWARPDAVVAKDYVRYLDPKTVTEEELTVLSVRFCADAAPAAASLGLSLEELKERSCPLNYGGWFTYVSRDDGDYIKYPDSLRTYNGSIGKARKIFNQ